MSIHFDHLWPLTLQDIIFYVIIASLWCWLIYESTLLPTYRQLSDDKYFRIRKPKFLWMIYVALALEILSLAIIGLIWVKVIQHGWEYSSSVRTIANSLIFLVACAFFIYYFSLFFETAHQQHLFHEKAKIAFQYLPTLKNSAHEKSTLNSFAVKHHSILSDPFQILKLIGLPLFLFYIVMFYICNSINRTLATLFHTSMMLILMTLCTVLGKTIARHEDTFFCRGMFRAQRFIQRS